MLNSKHERIEATTVGSVRRGPDRTSPPIGPRRAHDGSGFDLSAVGWAILRLWYVVLAGLLLTSGLTYFVFEKVPPSYTASAMVLLLPPDEDEAANPLLNLGGLDQPASLVVAYIASDASRAKFGERFPTAEYDVVLDPLSRGPLISFTMEDPSKTHVMEALRAVVATVPTALDSLQDQVAAPSPSRVSSMPLTIDVEPTLKLTDSVRALVAVAGGGIVMTLVLAVGIDSLVNRRRQRRGPEADVPTLGSSDEAATSAHEGSSANSTSTMPELGHNLARIGASSGEAATPSSPHRRADP